MNRCCGRLALALLMAWFVPAVDVAAQPVLYRIFLADGGTLVSFGEYARVADRVVFSMPIGAADGSNLQLISISEGAVDWKRTDEYTLAVRATQYAANRGPDDFALLGNRVTQALNDIRLTEDPNRRLAMAEEARRNLARWPSLNYGYRAKDVAHLVGTFDEVISELRISAGQTGFELSLAAITGPPPLVELLPPPDQETSLEQAFTAARLAPDAVDRVSLMEAIALALTEPARAGGWAAELHTRVARELAAEHRITGQYKRLVDRTIRDAADRAARADVRGVEALTRRVLDADDTLGRTRPREVSALLAYLDMRLEDARRLRLARDAWKMRSALFAEYNKKIAETVGQLRRAKGWLDDVERMAGPDPWTLDRHEQRIVMARRVFEQIEAPPELSSAQALYLAAFQMARRAASGRRNAVSSNDMQLARDASSAAAGAVMLLAQADEELERLTSSPER